MASSFYKLVGNLDKSCCVNTGKYYRGRQWNLRLRKGVYPYNYIDSLKRLDESQLPPKEAFYSKLNGNGISGKDYKHTKGMESVWDENSLS